MDPTPAPPKRHITFRHVALEHAGRHQQPLVLCPRKLQVVPVVDCRSCECFAGLCLNTVESGALLRCAFGDDAVDPLEREPSSHEPATRVRRALVSEIMSTPVRSATPEMSLDELTSLLVSQKISAVPVIDGSGVAIGIATRTDAMQGYQGHTEDLSCAQASAVIEGGSPYAEDVVRAVTEALTVAVKVRDIMTRSVFSMSADSSISRVAAVMAHEHVHHVLIVDGAGAIVGIVSSLDIARWFALSDGYVVPRRSPA